MGEVFPVSLRRGIYALALSITATTSIGYARAQSVSQPSAVAPTASSDGLACELHVWPGSPLRSTYLGWWHGGIVDGAVQGREGYKKLPDAPLDTARQEAVLKSLDLPALLGLAGYATVLHDTALDSRTLRNTPGRYSAQGGPCHAELAVDDAFFQNDIFSGRYLKVIFRFKRFSDGAVPVQTFGTIIAEPLTQFPPAKPGDDVEPGLAELHKAFGQSVHDFGVALNRPPRKKK